MFRKFKWGKLKQVSLMLALALMSVAAYADDPAYPDATSAVTSAGTLFASIGVIAAAILLWNIGSRLAKRYIK